MCLLSALRQSSKRKQRSSATHTTTTNKMSSGDASLNDQLLQAAEDLNLSLVRELLAKGADAAYLHDPEGVWGSQDSKTALHMALGSVSRKPAKEAEEGIEIIETLLAARADVNAKRARYDWRGCGSTSTAFEMLLDSKTLNTNPNLLEQFLARGADPNAKKISLRHSMRTDGHSSSVPLHTAVRRNDVHSAGVLLRAGANVNELSVESRHNERGHNQDLTRTPLHLAVLGGHLDMLLLLLAEEANPNVIGRHLDHVASGVGSPHDDPREEGYVSPVRCVPVDETALHMALQKNRPDMVRALLIAGADRTLTRSYDAKETTCEELAEGNQELTEALRTTSEWAPENHKFFAKGLKDQVRTVLLVAKSKGWKLPEDALFKIFTSLTASAASKAKRTSTASLSTSEKTDGEETEPEAALRQPESSEAA